MKNSARNDFTFDDLPTVSQLAGRIYDWRRGRGWSQAELAMKCGIARSTLSKVERGQLSPTFEILVKLAQGFGMGITELLASGVQSNLQARLDVDRGNAATPIEYPNHRLRPLASDMKGKKFEVFLVTFTCRDLDTFGAWNSHQTEDSLYVVSGTLEFHSEGYEPIKLTTGQCLRFDGQMRHACLSVGVGDCQCIYVCSSVGNVNTSN